MDRQISKEELKSRRRKSLLRMAVIVVIAVAVIAISVQMSREEVSREQIVSAIADRGPIEPSVVATGTVMPLSEEVVICPINSQILEVFHRSGDIVSKGTPLLRLDTQKAQDEYQKSADQLQMQKSQYERIVIGNRTYLNDLSMKVGVAEMKLERLEMELRNEKYLDSLGSGTHDKVKEAEFSCQVSRLELEQLRQHLANERRVKAADEREKQLEINIASRNLAEIGRVLADASVCSPRDAVITYIADEVGSQVAQGSRIAVVSDLNHFKINAAITDVYSECVTAGCRVVVKIGDDKMDGTIQSVTPQSKDGMMSFVVGLEDDSHHRLRAGLKVDVSVINAYKENVLRLPNSNYYIGPGEYELFVVEGDFLVKRPVRLGTCSYDKVEVVEGLTEGDEVVISDMKSYRDTKQIKLKQ